MIRPVSFLLLNSCWNAVLIPVIREHLWVFIPPSVSSILHVYLLSLETAVVSPPRLQLLVKQNKAICLISVHKVVGFGVNRYLTGGAESAFNYMERTPILDTTAGTHVQGKIIKNGTNSPDHSARPYLYLYPVRNLKCYIPLTLFPL